MGKCFLHINTFNKQMMGKITAAYNHNYRQIDVENADKSLAHMNEELISLQGKTYQEVVKDTLHYAETNQTRKLRSDATVAFEVVTTFSREDRDRIDLEKWKADNVKWLQKTFDIAPLEFGKNVKSIIYHGDEAGNVHCHAFIVPINEKGLLRYKDLVHGPVHLRELQNDYAKEMKEHHGLDRGIEGSKAKHKDVKEFYNLLNKALYTDVPEQLPNEDIVTYTARLKDALRTANIHALDQKLKDEQKLNATVSDKDNRIKQLNQQLKAEKFSKHKLEKQHEDIEREFGSLNVALNMARRIKDVQTALLQQNSAYFKNEEEAIELKDIFNGLMAEGAKERKRRERIAEKNMKDIEI